MILFKTIKMLPKIEHYKSWILTTGLDVATANGKGPEATFYGTARKEILGKYPTISLESYKCILKTFPSSEPRNKKEFISFTYIIKDGYREELDQLELILNN
jgi:hypothetical protein